MVGLNCSEFWASLTIHKLVRAENYDFLSIFLHSQLPERVGNNGWVECLSIA